MPAALLLSANLSITFAHFAEIEFLMNIQIQKPGRILSGDKTAITEAYAAWMKQPVDQDFLDDEPEPVITGERTIAKPVEVTGPGTFFGKSERTLKIEPCEKGWWFDRTDLPDCLATEVSVRNVWTLGAIVSNIVLRSGPPDNYIRMIEHMVALKLGLGIDSLLFRLDSGDPPLFERGSVDLVEAIEDAGVRQLNRPVRYVTVKEPVTVGSEAGGFLTFIPCNNRLPLLTVDSAVDFNDAIGQQRIRFPVTPTHFRYGAAARTNTTAAKRFYAQTIGKIFADVRNLGYTDKNILVAGRRRYHNKPRLIHQGKSLEAAWHRAALDLLAGLALIDSGRFVGHVISYKAGHRLDVHMITKLYLDDLLIEWTAV